MGRPKKRQRPDEPSEPQTIPTNNASFVDPSASRADSDRTNFENVCPGGLASSVIHKNHPGSRSAARSLDNTPPSENPRTPSDSELFNTSYPQDFSMWPDFSETAVPVPLFDSNPNPSKTIPDTTTSTSTQSQTDSANIPDCPCLPNLYLTLSTLSTLSSFPVTPQTIDTLASAHRTAHSVIYCAICPQKFQTGSQNVMLSNTLLIVLVDQWLRVLRAPANQLEKGFSRAPPSIHMSQITELEWKTFAHDLMRAHVFGDRQISPPPTSQPAHNTPLLPPASEDLTLMGLAECMERRQRQYHGHEPETGEFAQRMNNDLAHGHNAGLTLDDLRRMEKEHKENMTNAGGEHVGKGFLCLQLATHAKRCIRTLDRGPPTLGDCTQPPPLTQSAASNKSGFPTFI
jgi:hypothetical protein